MENKSTTPENNSASAKTQRIRSVAYPSNTIEHCINLTSSIYKEFGNVFATREKISQQLEISDSHLQTQLSSCVQYGLLELKSKEGYKQTPLFTRIYKPLPSEKKEDALLESFRNPELYKNIIKEYNNETLTINGLSIILFRNHKVSDSASSLAAKIFLENAKHLGLLKDDNLFSINSGVVVTEEMIETEEEVITPQNDNDNKKQEVIYLPPPKNQDTENKKEFNQKKYNSPPIPVFVDENGSVAEIYLPNGFNKQHIEKIIKVLTAQIS